MRALCAIVASAGALIVVGSLADWTGVGYSPHLDRGVALAAGALTIVTSGLAIVFSRRFLALTIPFGGVALGVAVVTYDDVANKLYEYRDYPDATVGVGLYLVIVGAALAIAAGLAAFVPGRWRAGARGGTA